MVRCASASDPHAGRRYAPALDPTRQILEGSRHADKTFGYARQDPSQPVEWWFQQGPEGLVLFVVFYTLACRWNRCLGCNLPSKSSLEPVTYRYVCAQVDRLFADPDVRARASELRKVILSNNGSVLDQLTFPTTAFMYLLARLNLELPGIRVLSMETRAEYVEWEELELVARVLRERDPAAELELAVGFEAFDDEIRNHVFNKGLSLPVFEKLVEMVGDQGYSLKCYFMQKPVPGMSDEAAITDIHRAIDYLDELASRHHVRLNLHLNPTYVAASTPLAQAFARGDYSPPTLLDVARAARHARGTRVSVFIGLFDEGLAVPGGSFLRPGEEREVEQLEQFNRTQDFALLDELLAAT